MAAVSAEVDRIARDREGLERAMAAINVFSRRPMFSVVRVSLIYSSIISLAIALLLLLVFGYVNV